MKWEDLCGNSLNLPLQLGNSQVIDQIRPGEGLLNKIKLSVDATGNPIVTYQKYKTVNGTRTTQVYNARWNPEKSFVISQMTQWSTAMKIEGKGTLRHDAYSIAYGPLTLKNDGTLVQSFSRAKADTEGLPESGVYLIHANADGSLTRTETKYKNPAKSGDYDYSVPLPKAATTAKSRQETPTPPFVVKTLWSRTDLRTQHHSWNPSHQFAITWEARDSHYDCQGNPIQRGLGHGDGVVQLCGNKFITELNFWEYDLRTQKWNQTLIDSIWGGSLVDIDFLTYKNLQFIAYYNKDRHITVASRTIGQPSWTIQVLDSVFNGWDDHNTLTVEVDNAENVHISGNHHVNPLNYYLARSPSRQFARAKMVGELESKVTYSRFFRLPLGEFAFSYRDGSSGNGNTILNVLNSTTMTWKRLSETPLFEGKETD